MNGKQAKRLRRAALGFAATIEQSGRPVEKDGYTLEKRIAASPHSVRSDLSPDEGPTLTSVTIHVDETTVKGIYKKFKKGVRQ